MKTVTLSNKNFIHSQNETLLICQIKVLLIYQMKTVNFTNSIILFHKQMLHKKMANF